MIKRVVFTAALLIALSAQPSMAQSQLSGVTMQIDIMPANCPNNILILGERTLIRPGAARVGNNALIQVAVAGTPSLDASTYEPMTANLAGISPIRYMYKDVMTAGLPQETPCECYNPGGDGFLDLVLYFKRSDLLSALEPIVNWELRNVTLTIMRSGYLEEGADCVMIAKLNGKATPASAVLPNVDELRNYPNPFNAGTVLTFELREPGNVSLVVYDVLGRQVARLVDGFQPSGLHEITWDGTDDNGATLGSGMYFYRIKAGSFSATKKMTLLR